MSISQFHNSETIAAIATPAGSGGIAVIRLSGPAAPGIAAGVFRGSVDLLTAEPGRVRFGRIIDGPEVIDEVLLTVFRAPSSYTGEDVVEVSCHGGMYVTRRILEIFLRRGARLAEPGEFTKRAFLKGKLDLSQAEAVADLIQAKTESSRKSSVAQLEGVLSRRIDGIRDQLINLCSLVELELDFSEEDLGFPSRGQVLLGIEKVAEELQALLATFSHGRILREGARLVIAGRPNVGKSSLLNALLRQDRAIVTEIPGTTRDVLEEQLDIRGVLFRVMDTAGLRTTSDVLEREGVQRTEKSLKLADIVLLLLDGSEQFTPEDEAIVAKVSAIGQNGRGPQLVVGINKIDLEQRLEREEIKARVGRAPVVELSAREGRGLDQLEEVLVEQVVDSEGFRGDGPVITNLRHHEALQRAAESLALARQSALEGLSWEFVALDLRAALNCLGEITGAVTTEEILNDIFSRFCIGK